MQEARVSANLQLASLYLKTKSLSQRDKLYSYLCQKLELTKLAKRLLAQKPSFKRKLETNQALCRIVMFWGGFLETVSMGEGRHTGGDFAQRIHEAFELGIAYHRDQKRKRHGVREIGCDTLTQVQELVSTMYSLCRSKVLVLGSL